MAEIDDQPKTFLMYVTNESGKPILIENVAASTIESAAELYYSHIDGVYDGGNAVEGEESNDSRNSVAKNLLEVLGVPNDQSNIYCLVLQHEIRLGNCIFDMTNLHSLKIQGSLDLRKKDIPEITTSIVLPYDSINGIHLIPEKKTLFGSVISRVIVDVKGTETSPGYLIGIGKFKDSTHKRVKRYVKMEEIGRID